MAGVVTGYLVFEDPKELIGSVLEVWIRSSSKLVAAFIERMKIEPVGFLHLERLEFAPAGIERGELVYSLPLAPNEEVNIAHKEWSNTSEEFERIVTDSLDTYSEEGVTEKSELAEATDSQHQHSMGLNTAVSSSGTFYGVTISASLGLNVSDSATRSMKSSRNHSLDVTRKASARVKKEHKMSFRVASASGMENESVRKITNPLQTPQRVDYFQLIRKWEINLFRYGVRLTFDLNIPEPGSDILDKLREIRDIDEQLKGEFVFDLKHEDISTSPIIGGDYPLGYLELAEKFGAHVEPPPKSPDSRRAVVRHNWRGKPPDERLAHIHTNEELDVPEDYEVVEAKAFYAWFGWEGTEHEKPNEQFDVWFDSAQERYEWVDMPKMIGRSGKLPIVYTTADLEWLGLYVELTIHPRAEVIERWRHGVWTALREAAQARYYETRSMLKERRARLLEEVGGDDALSLRKIEREEIMKGVLRWLCGPGFDFVPRDLALENTEGLYRSGSRDVATDTVWTEMLNQGELIKFLHHAIEWENMLYVLYPYFWSYDWDFKKFLTHPDPLHRVFLKSGSARVVFTIREGFEADFCSLMENGEFKSLEATHPYRTIGEELKAYAKTNYPGIPPANPEKNYRGLLTRKQQKAWDDIQAICKLLEEYLAEHGRYPTEAELLIILEGHALRADPWGNDYIYQCPGEYGDYDVSSGGGPAPADGSNEPDESHPITSWAEASLIGRWYEYTPTSALDIEISAPDVFPDNTV